MWDYLMYVYYHIDNSPLALIWVILLIESMFNKNVKGANRIWWFIFIAWTHIFGAAIYFFFGPSQIYLRLFRKARPYFQSSTPTTQGQPQAPQFYQNTPTHYQPPAPVQPPLPPYQQGYTPPLYIPSHSAPETQYADPTYEQPQATYPELTQEQ